jgi:predicted RNA polymerase sigma factor
MSTWTPEEIESHIAYQRELNDELTERGELVDAQAAGLALLEPLEETLDGHHRLRAARAHLLEMSGEKGAAVGEYAAAAERTNSLPEQRYLQTKAPRLRAAGREKS